MYHIPISEPKRAFDLIIGGTLSQFSNIGIERSRVPTIYEIRVGKYKGLLGVKSYSNDIHGILKGKAVGIFKRKLLRMEEFLVIGQHDNQWNVKHIL